MEKNCIQQDIIMEMLSKRCHPLETDFPVLLMYDISYALPIKSYANRLIFFIQVDTKLTAPLQNGWNGGLFLFANWREAIRSENSKKILRAAHYTGRCAISDNAIQHGYFEGSGSNRRFLPSEYRKYCSCPVRFVVPYPAAAVAASVPSVSMAFFSFCYFFPFLFL